MNHRYLLAVLLAFAVLGANGTLHAQARGRAARGVRSTETQVEKPAPVLNEAFHAEKIKEMEAWLGRLVGRFQGDSRWNWAFGTQRNHSSVSCSGIGDGPGVRCILGPNMPLLYFGIKRESLEIQVVVIDVEQPAARSGMLAGDTVSFATDNWKICHGIWSVCWMAAEVTAKPAGEIFMKIFADMWSQGRRNSIMKSGHTLDIELHMQREPDAHKN